MLPMLGKLSEIIPRDTLAHRLDKILRQGCEYLNGNDYERLVSMNVPTLVIASERDNLIPSVAESERLQKFLPKCKVEIVKGASHALLQEPGTNVIEIAKRNGFLPRKATDPVMTRDAKFDPPSAADIERARESLAGLRALTSPVFFSTRPDGKIIRGLGAVPIRQRANRPILLVGNHQTMAPDLGFLVDQFLREYDVCVRGLAHPVVARGGGGFGSENESADGTLPATRSLEDMFRDAVQSTPIETLLPRREPKPPRRAMAMGGLGNFTQFGAVPVSGMNFFRLLKQGEAVLLFPGGVREAFKRRDEKYELFWPSKPEFVRMAIKHNAIIVPFAAVGAEDSIDIVADSRDLMNSPLVGNSVRERSQNVPKARAVDTRVTDDDGEEELFIQPIVVPKAPERFYFRFMPPIDVKEINLDDEERVKEVYAQVKTSCEDGIEYLRANRSRDPFGNLSSRLLYEAATSGQAPTFDP
jgi:1-acyl-sn-glycerol-3-phosphate acyltransferase